LFYLFHGVLQHGWRVNPTDSDVGPSTTIDGYFQRWGGEPLDDLSKIRKKAVIVIENVYNAIDQIGQTTVRNVVGRFSLDQLLWDTAAINLPGTP
jgi:hypothetical protein